jgi:hypothetical protein
MKMTRRVNPNSLASVTRCVGTSTLNVELLKGEERDSREMIDDPLIVVKRNFSCAFRIITIREWTFGTGNKMLSHRDLPNNVRFDFMTH